MLHDKPLAAHGLISYRCINPYGNYIMIGAKDHAAAYVQALRSAVTAKREDLEVWCTTRECYIKY